MEFWSIVCTVLVAILLFKVIDVGAYVLFVWVKQKIYDLGGIEGILRMLMGFIVFVTIFSALGFFYIFMTNAQLRVSTIKFIEQLFQ